MEDPEEENEFSQMKKELPKEIFPTYLNLTSILERFDNDTFSSFNQIEKHLESFVEKLS